MRYSNPAQVMYEAEHYFKVLEEEAIAQMQAQQEEDKKTDGN